MVKTVPAGPLTIRVYTAPEAGLNVVSALVMGQKEAILIDAQYTLADAEKLVAELKTSGRSLKAIYISHSDPDYYFGLLPLKAAFPQTIVYATQPTINTILATAQYKLDYWGPIMGAAIANNVVLPQLLKGDHLELEGHRLDIKGLDGADAVNSFVWIPDAKAIVGGRSLFSGLHLWMTDVNTPELRTAYHARLSVMTALRPTLVIPAHQKDDQVLDASIIAYNEKYLTEYEAELSKATNSAQLIEAMKKLYPQAGLETGLELGAQVTKGEIKF